MRLLHRLRARLGWGLGLKTLAVRLGMPIEVLQGARIRYSEARIPKRSGGTRRLLIPSDETKGIQRRVLRRLLARLRAHPAATGFERGRSIVDNARPHVGRHVVIKMDVIDFFPTTTAERVEAYFRRIGWNRKAAALLTHVTTHEDGLPQGAPTSPRLSNLVNHGLDARLSRMVERRHGRYTRYADDITISFDRHRRPGRDARRVRGTVQMATRLLRAHGYRAHRDRKLKVLYRHRLQRVTGLVVNDKLQLPRAIRRRLRAIRHRKAATGACSLSDAQLAGWSAFEQMVARG